MNPALVFDGLAAGYDETFTGSVIGQRMRAAVWRRLDARFEPGDHVLELNCGTGEDALHLAQRGVRVLSTDIAPAMVDAARRKVVAGGVEGRVRVERMAIEEIGPSLGTFDGALSNFGGLNCVADLHATSSALAGCVRPGGVAVVCVMGPLVPWEWLWFLARREPSRAFRRLRRGGAAWRGLTIRYPSIRRLRAAFSQHFSLARLGAIGVLLPPPYASAWAGRHPRWLDALDRAERAAETMWPLPHFADHYLAEFQRTGPGVST